nr:RecName: Full=Insertion element ISR1 uncharacterized 30.8 kDa protein A [Rhizobium sp.]CAA29833.1 unnamed protein product [Rhizobium sp.]
MPLSLTMVSGRPRCRMTASNSRTTRAPDSEVSATSAKHSRVQLSITVRMRKRRPSVSWSATKSATSAGWAPAAGHGRRVPIARLRRAPAHRQLLVAIDPLDPFPVDRMALAPQQHVQATIAEPSTFLARAFSRSRRARRPGASPDSARSSDRRPEHGTPAFRSSRRRPADGQPPRDSRRASPLFSQQVLQGHVVQHRVRQHPLQPGVLILERLEPPSLRHVEPAKLGLPFVKGRRADPVASAHLRRRYTGLLLPQDPDDLLFREPRSLHSVRPSLGGL